MILPAPYGSHVRLHYDSATLVEEGDYLRTESGRLYEVIGVRVQERGKHAGRQHLTAIVSRGAPDDARVHPLHWYSRRATR